MDRGDMDIVSTGWLRVFPEPALEAYVAIWQLAHADGGPVAGDLDELGPDAFGIPDGGFDEPYDPGRDGRSADDPTWVERWEEWRRYAAKRGRRMTNNRDVIEFMNEIGIVERVVDGGRVYWRPPPVVPLAEDALPLSRERREQEAELRWRDQFRSAENRVTNWLVERQTDNPQLRVTVSLRELAAELDLDVEDVRHGLASAEGAARDMLVSRDPELAAADESLEITVDWRRFADERIAVRLGDSK